MVKISCFKETSDDWYGNYKIEDARHVNKKYVEVSFLSLGPKASFGWRVCVWGNDDCGMEKDFPTGDRGYEHAVDLYWELCLLEIISKSELKDLGFGYA